MMSFDPELASNHWAMPLCTGVAAIRPIDHEKMRRIEINSCRNLALVSEDDLTLLPSGIRFTDHPSELIRAHLSI